MTAAANVNPAPRRKPRQAYVRVQPDGSLRCADEFSRDSIRRYKPKDGDLVRVVFSKPRDYGQWKKAHVLGQLIAENLSEFEGLEAHDALKKLQRLSGVECDDMDMELPGIGKMVIRQPRSLAFEEMDEGTFQRAYAGFCSHIIKTWWPDLDVFQIEEMASLVGMAA